MVRCVDDAQPWRWRRKPIEVGADDRAHVAHRPVGTCNAGREPGRRAVAAAGGLGRRHTDGGGGGPQSRPQRRRGGLRGPGGDGRDRARIEGGRLDLQRHHSGPDDPGEGRRPPDRALHEQPAAAEHHPLARPAGPHRDGRRARLLPGTGPAGRDVHLRLRGAGRRHLLVPPARDVGRAGRLRPLRRLPGGGLDRDRDDRHCRRSRPRAQRHRCRRRRRAAARGHRRHGRDAVRPRGQPRAGQRPPAAGAGRAVGSAAALAGGERGQEPLLQARPRRGARLPQDRRRRGPDGVLRGPRLHRARRRRAGRRAGDADRRAGRRGTGPFAAPRPRLRQHLRARFREPVHDPLRGRATVRPGPAAPHQPRDGALRPRGGDRNRPGADPPGRPVRPDLRLRHQPRALLESEADPRRSRRDPGLERDQLHRVVASAAPARLLLPGPRRGRRAGPPPWSGRTRWTSRTSAPCAWPCASTSVRARGSSTATSSITPTAAC